MKKIKEKKVARKPNDEKRKNNGLIPLILLGGGVYWALSRKDRGSSEISNLEIDSINTIAEKIANGEELTSAEKEIYERDKETIDALANYIKNGSLNSILDLEEKFLISGSQIATTAFDIRKSNKVTLQSRSLVYATTSDADVAEANTLISDNRINSFFVGGTGRNIMNAGNRVTQTVHFINVGNEHGEGDHSVAEGDILMVPLSVESYDRCLLAITRSFALSMVFTDGKNDYILNRIVKTNSKLSVFRLINLRGKGLLLEQWHEKFEVSGKRKYGFAGPRRKKVLYRARYKSGTCDIRLKGYIIECTNPGLACFFEQDRKENTDA